MSEYVLEEKCYGCNSENELRQVTVNEFDMTLCYRCEQKIISAMLSGGL